MRIERRRAVTRDWTEPHPQPLAGQGEQPPEHMREQDELDAFSAWLAHVDARRIG